MAIGDAVAVFLGTAAANRQPSSGVEEQISAACKNDSVSSDTVNLYDGTDAVVLIAAGVRTHGSAGHSARIPWNPYNMAQMINNTVYLRKAGTTAYIYVGGVQTAA